MIKVIVTGAAGKMGREVCRAALADKDIELVGAVDPNPSEQAVAELRSAAGIDIHHQLPELLKKTRADVLVDFTHAAAVTTNATVAVSAGMHVVIGTTGLSEGEISRLKELAESTISNILLAPNFAVGAVLMMKLSETAAAYADRAEIIELHHDKKADAPSGTAKMTAELMSERLEQRPLAEEEKIAGVRGGLIGDIPVHSVRLPGLVAHQEVILGFQGQTLTIRHDSTDRTSFMPGVMLAVKRIADHRGFIYGLDKILGI